jgi:DNA-binding NarL/FixJ family response regulator
MNVGIIDDQEDFLDSLSEYLSTLPNVKCPVKAKNTDRFFRYFKYEPTLHLDIVFVDLNLGNESGLDAIPRIKKRFPQSEVIIFSVNEDADTLIKSFCLGATGYILKDTPLSEFEGFINTIAEGGSAISPRMARKLVQYFAPSPRVMENLFNEREHQILKLLAEGWAYKEVADKVGLSIDGVRFYIKRIYKALNVNSKSELIKVYLGRKDLFS